MNIFVFLWNSIFYHPIVNLILFIYKFGGHNLGIAIIILTIIIRLLLWPFMKNQITYMKKLQELKPQLDALKSKHKDDQRAYQEAQLNFYKQNGVNPAGSCLPLIIQLPFIYAVYNVIRTASTASSQAVFNNIAYTKNLQLPVHGHFNTSFLGLDLAKDAATVGTHHLNVFVLYVILAVLVGITQYFASKVSMPATVVETTETVEMIEEPQNKKQLAAKVAAKPGMDPEAFSQSLSKQMLIVLPLILTFLSLGYGGHIPAGLSVYWVVQSLCIVIQTLVLQKPLWKKN